MPFIFLSLFFHQVGSGVEDQKFLLGYLRKYYANGTLFDAQDLRSEGDLSGEFRQYQAVAELTMSLKQFLETTINALRDKGDIETITKREQEKHRLVNVAELENEVMDIVRASQQKESTLEYGKKKTRRAWWMPLKMLIFFFS